MFPEAKIKSRFRKSHLLKLINEMLNAPLLKSDPKGKRWFELKDLTPEQIVNLISYQGVLIPDFKSPNGDHYIVYHSEYAKRMKSPDPAREGNLFWEEGARFEVHFDDSARWAGQLRKNVSFSGTDEQYIDCEIKTKLLSRFLKDNSAIPVYL